MTKLTEPQQKWVDALRSGEYGQGTGQLESNGGFCCLGVACKVAEKEEIKVKKIKNQITGGSLIDQPYVKDWLGLKNSHGRYAQNSYLTTLNDNSRLNFTEIADVIEENAETLFVGNE